MNDFSDITPPASRPGEADGELLLAYLAGELDEAAATRLESRLVAEPGLRGALERERALGELFAAASPPPPPGAGDRLRARLAAERETMAAAAAPSAMPSTDAASAPASLDAARARRRPGRVRWSVIGSVAAVLVALAVVGANVLAGGFTGGAADLALEDDDDAAGARDLADAATGGEGEAGEDGEAGTMAAPDAAAESGPMLEDADDTATDMDTAEGAADGAAADAEETLEGDDELPPTFRIVGPEIVDERVRLADEDSLALHLTDRPGVAGLLGTMPPEAAELADAFATAVRDADVFGDGRRPDACLDAVTRHAVGMPVPARVERLVFQGIPVTAYVLATSSGVEGTLDQLEAWVVDDSCATQQYLLLPS
jgi:hypothetical protein